MSDGCPNLTVRPPKGTNLTNLGTNKSTTFGSVGNVPPRRIKYVLPPPGGGGRSATRGETRDVNTGRLIITRNGATVDRTGRSVNSRLRNNGDAGGTGPKFFLVFRLNDFPFGAIFSRWRRKKPKQKNRPFPPITPLPFGTKFSNRRRVPITGSRESF